MKAVMISIQPKWCGMILEGEKSIEIRKNAPNIKPPFKCYIYCTIGGDPLFLVNGKPMLNRFVLPLNQHSTVWELNGGVIAEFVCDEIIPINVFYNGTIQYYHANRLDRSGVPYDLISEYIGAGKVGRGWHISELKIYDRPKELHEFNQCHKCEYHEGCVQHEYSCAGHYKLQRPPQSWCYVEELR